MRRKPPVTATPLSYNHRASALLYPDSPIRCDSSSDSCILRLGVCLRSLRYPPLFETLVAESSAFRIPRVSIGIRYFPSTAGVMASKFPLGPMQRNM